MGNRKDKVILGILWAILYIGSLTLLIAMMNILLN